MMAKTGVRHYKQMKAINPPQLGAVRAKQWTQEQFAGNTGLPVTSISEAENNKLISLRCAEMYAKGLGRPVEDLFFCVQKGASISSEQSSGVPSSTNLSPAILDRHPEKNDVQWMQLLKALPWQDSYCITECAWVYRFPGVGVDAIKLSYDGDRKSSQYSVNMPTLVCKAAKRWHHKHNEKEEEIRAEKWGLQVRLERVESRHAAAHVLRLSPMKYLYYVAVQQKLWSDFHLRTLRKKAFDNAVKGLPAGSPMVLPSHFAIHMGVITRDGFALLRQRREDTELYPSAWEAGIGEFMHGPKYKGRFPHFLRGKPNLTLFLKNAVAEELGYFKARASDFAIYGFAVEHQTLAPKLIVVYTSDADIDILCEGGKNRTITWGRKRKKVETDWSPDVRAIKLNPIEIAKAFRRFPDWGPTSRLTLMLALRQVADTEEAYWILVEEIRRMMEAS
jgi:DNA-binding XRE family transcriptional regulator